METATGVVCVPQTLYECFELDDERMCLFCDLFYPSLVDPILVLDIWRRLF